MFKFIHAADLHLDSPLMGLSRYETAPVEAIRRATRRAFENMVELALEERAAFVLLAGDLFDGDWRDHQTGIYFNQQMGHLDRQGIPVFVVAGNHDAASRITKALHPPPNVTYLSTRKPESIPLPDLGAVVHGQGFRDQHTTTNLAADFPQAVPGRFNIGLLHTSLDGREGHAPYAPCSLDDLVHKGYRYWALGHVHRREIVCEDPLIVFPGCTQGRHIHENGSKGCTLVTVEDGTVVEHEHRALDTVRWAQLILDVTGVEDERELVDRIRQAIGEALAGAESRLLALRVDIGGATALNDRLRAAPEKWRTQVQALGAESGVAQVWIEKVRIRTQGRRSLDEAMGSDNALGGLLATVMAQQTAIGSVPGLDRVVAELKLPPDFFRGEEAYEPASPEVVAEVIAEAKALLVARLLETEGEA